jgi:hypothetical protein
VQRIPIGELPDVDTDAVLAHIKTLSSDEFEGRGPGTKGEELTVAYLVDQFKKLGLKPGNTDGSYIQKVPLVGITPAPASLTFKKSGDTRELKWKDDVVAWTKHVADSASVTNSDVVFVGYGVVAPEYNWDDYKGVDTKGKTLVMLVNDPPVSDPCESCRARCEDIWRPGDDLLRPLDLQVRDRCGKGRRRRVDHSRNWACRLPVRRHPEQGHGAIRPRHARQEHGTRRHRGVDYDRSRSRTLEDGRPGLRRAEETGGDARLQAGAAWRANVDDDQEPAAHD